MRTSRVGSSGAPAFTLLEVLIVIALAALLAALVLPRWWALVRPHPEDALRPLAGSWSELRWTAVMTGRPVRLRWFARRWEAQAREWRGEKPIWRLLAQGEYPKGWRLAAATPRFAGVWAKEGAPPLAELTVPPTGAFAPVRLRFAEHKTALIVRVPPLPAPVQVVRAR